jgi:hypothetical protein
MKTLLIHSLIIVSMMVSAPALAQGDPLRVGMSGQYFPFTFVEQDTLKGFEVDVMNQLATLCKHLELLLALLRTRESDDKKSQTLLAPNKKLTKRYVDLIDDISKVVIDNNIELKSRISLQIEKPEMFRDTPDLLYALWTYLTGDSGANTIIITGISDED